MKNEKWKWNEMKMKMNEHRNEKEKWKWNEMKMKMNETLKMGNEKRTNENFDSDCKIENSILKSCSIPYSDSEVDSNSSLPNLISDSDSEVDSNSSLPNLISDSDSESSDYKVYRKKIDVYKCTCNEFIENINIPVVKEKGCKHIKSVL